jgi:beta propeller repeat protein
LLIPSAQSLPDEQSAGHQILEIHNYTLHSLDIDGDQIVWSDSSLGADHKGIFVYNITTGAQQTVSIKPLNTRITGGSIIKESPSISGDLVVWADMNDIHLLNLSGGPEVFVTDAFFSDTFADDKVSSYPVIDGDRIAWSEQPTSQNGWKRQMVLYNLTTRERKTISPTTSDQIYPDISGNYVVWRDHRISEEMPAIFLYDIVTGNSTMISEEGRPSTKPEIDNGTAVWDSIDLNGEFHASIYDIRNGTIQWLDPGTSYEQKSPEVSGNRIVWLQSRPYRLNPGGEQDLMFLERSTGTKKRLIAGNPNLIDPQISGNRIIYCENTADSSSQHTCRVHLIVLNDTLSVDLLPVQSIHPDALENRSPVVSSTESPRVSVTAVPGFSAFITLTAICSLAWAMRKR